MDKSKRGRRPKVPVNSTRVENTTSDAPIIAHLPIDLSDVINGRLKGRMPTSHMYRTWLSLCYRAAARTTYIYVHIYKSMTSPIFTVDVS